MQARSSSILIVIPAIQASVTELGALGASLKANNDTVAADRTNVASDIEMEANTRRAVDGELLTLKAAVESDIDRSRPALGSRLPLGATR